MSKRKITILSCGDESWEPTANELSLLVSMFMGGTQDPLGTVMAVRGPTAVKQIDLDLKEWEQLEVVTLNALLSDDVVAAAVAAYNQECQLGSPRSEATKKFRAEVTKWFTS